MSNLETKLGTKKNKTKKT